MLDRQFITAIIITTLAGLSTSIGGAIGFIVTSKNLKFFSFTIGFTGGIMVGISFFELMPSGIEELGFLKACLAFFVGFICFLCRRRGYSYLPQMPAHPLIIPQSERRVLVRHQRGVGCHAECPAVESHHQLKNTLWVLSGEQKAKAGKNS